MKKKLIIPAVFFAMIAVLSGNVVAAQPMLQGRPSVDNFIGSPGMWVIAVAVVLFTAMLIVMKKKTKLRPQEIKNKH